MDYIWKVGKFVIAMLTGNLGKDSHELSVLISIVDFPVMPCYDVDPYTWNYWVLEYFIRRKKNESNLVWENCYILNAYYHLCLGYCDFLTILGVFNISRLAVCVKKVVAKIIHALWWLFDQFVPLCRNNNNLLK